MLRVCFLFSNWLSCSSKSLHAFFPHVTLCYNIFLLSKKLLFDSFQVLGGFDPSSYVTERKWAVASDGTQVPISIFYKKDLVKLDGSDPMLLYGYGSYEVTFGFLLSATV